MIIGNWSPSIPAGLFSRALFYGLLNSNASEPRVLDQTIDGCQFSDEVQDLQRDGSVALALKLVLPEERQVRPPEPTTEMGTASRQGPSRLR